MRFRLDADAIDGHALDLAFRVDTCRCFQIQELPNSCADSITPGFRGSDSINYRNSSTGYIASCPYPWKPGTRTPSYEHAPYGKYEVREKIPAMLHHTNFWGAGSQLMDYSVGETKPNEMVARYPSFGQALTFGPCHGYFKIVGADTLFISYDDTLADRAREPVGKFTDIIINGFGYQAIPWGLPPHRVKAIAGRPFPSSLATSTDTFTFYYHRFNQLSSDTVAWRVTKGSDSLWDVFSAPYHIRGTDTVLFTRDYQPVTISISEIGPLGDTTVHIHRCHWSAALNTPVNKGLLFLDDRLNPGNSKTNLEAFGYLLPDHSGPNHSGFGMRSPGYVMGPNPMGPDSNAYKLQPFRYHTIAMEYLPHEVRFVYDSAVVWRIPDRMLPPSSPYYHWVEGFGRDGLFLQPGEFNGGEDTIPKYFLSHLSNSGFYDVTVNGVTHHAAHHLLDYVKMSDLPSYIKVSNFPH